MKRNKMKCNETWDKSINEKHRHNLLFLKKQKTNFKRREILVVDHFSLFVCLLFRFETRDSGKDEWPKKKLNGQQNTLRDIRPSLIRQNKPPLLLSAQDLCFFFFLVFLSTETSTAAYFVYLQGSLGRSLRVPIYQMWALEFRRHWNKSWNPALCCSFLLGRAKEGTGPPASFVLCLFWMRFFNPGVSCLLVYLHRFNLTAE